MAEKKKVEEPDAHQHEKIDKSQGTSFKFKNGKKWDVETSVLEMMYDAQLKKMLAYVGLGISSFIPQLQLFFFLLNRPEISILIARMLGFLSFFFLVAQVFFVTAVTAKFHELMVMESKLGFDIMYKQVFYRTKPWIAKMYDRIWERVAVRKGISKEENEEKRFLKANMFLNGITSFIVFLLTIIWLSIIYLVVTV